MGDAFQGGRFWWLEGFWGAAEAKLNTVNFGGSSEHSLFVYNLFDKYTIELAIIKLTYSSQKVLRRYEDERLTVVIKVKVASSLRS